MVSEPGCCCLCSMGMRIAGTTGTTGIVRATATIGPAGTTRTAGTGLSSVLP